MLPVILTMFIVLYMKEYLNQTKVLNLDFPGQLEQYINIYGLFIQIQVHFSLNKTAISFNFDSFPSIITVTK